MITIISPAKNMKVRKLDNLSLTKCQFPEKTKIIMDTLKKCTPWELESYMKINEKLATKAFEDIQAFDLNAEGSQAIVTYDGLVFKHADAIHWGSKEFAFAQDHLRILSGCYGILRPLDGICPYRLEMQCKIPIEGKNLYEFWGEDLYENLYREGEVVINLASEEYAKCIRKYAKKSPMIDIEFLSWNKGVLKIVGTKAKMARGHMVRDIVENNIDDVEKLKAFSWDGFQYDETRSTSHKLTFVQE